MSDEDKQQAQPEKQPVEEPAADEAPAQEPPLPEVDVFDILRMTLGLFVQEAWVGLGLQARQGTAETKTDLRCARIAIDMVEVMAEKLSEEADEDERRTINQMLTDLRVNFVRVSAKPEEQS